MRSSNHLIGLLNFLTFLLSIPILGGGIWLSSRANSTDCMQFLQWPLIVIGVAIMVISLAGFAGACYRNTFLMWVYLFCMFFVIAALISFIIFAYGVTDKGRGRPVTNRAYLDYYLQDYSGWLEDRVASDSYWTKISSCIRDSKACKKIAVTVNGVPETESMFYLRKLNPIQVKLKTLLSFSLLFLGFAWISSNYRSKCSTVVTVLHRCLSMTPVNQTRLKEETFVLIYPISIVYQES